MPMAPIVRSLLETDLYKFTMWQALLHSHPNSHTEYEFVCRNAPVFPLAELKDTVERELDHLCTMAFAEDELDYLRSLRYIKSDFVDFLTVFRFQRKFIRVSAEGDTLRIHAAGPQVHVMAFEIFVLYIVNELYFRRFDGAAALAEGRARLDDKIAALRAFGQQPALRHPFEFSDFGVRRRFSAAWHEEVVFRLAQEVPQYFKGTSNVYLAKRFGLVPIGTMAHEYMQSFQAFGVRLRDFQKAALEAWVQEYRGDLGVALTDVVGMDAFLDDFDLYFAKLYDARLVHSYLDIDFMRFRCLSTRKSVWRHPRKQFFVDTRAGKPGYRSKRTSVLAAAFWPVSSIHCWTLGRVHRKSPSPNRYALGGSFPGHRLSFL